MSERIAKTAVTRRIAELEQAERDAVTQVQLIRTVLAEMRALLNPVVITTGEQETEDNAP